MGKIKQSRKVTYRKSKTTKSKNGPTIYDTFDCRNREVEDVWLVN